MQSVGLFLKTRSEIIDWHREHYPANVPLYEELLVNIKSSNFLGSVELLKKEKDESGDNFLATLTELNLAQKILAKGLSDLKYEQERKVDFTFGNLVISVKSLNVKAYEKRIQEIVLLLMKQGGGRDSFTYKGGSTITVIVTPTGDGTFSEEISETGSLRYLDTDYAHLQGLLGSLAEFESVPAQGRKKVLFVMNYSESFREYYAKDLASWYFGFTEEHPIFPDPDIYLKYFGKDAKDNNIDAIVFVMYPLVPFLVWIDGRLEKANESSVMTLIFSPDEALTKQLKDLLFT